MTAQQLYLFSGLYPVVLVVVGRTRPDGVPFLHSKAHQPLASVVSHSDGILSSTARARRTFSRIRSAFAVHTNPRALSL
jgi:hypothetical protein